jgi:hypothetical protein
MNIRIWEEESEVTTESPEEGGPSQNGSEYTAGHQKEEVNEEGPSNDHMSNKEGEHLQEGNEDTGRYFAEGNITKEDVKARTAHMKKKMAAGPDGQCITLRITGFRDFVHHPEF